MARTSITWQPINGKSLDFETMHQSPGSIADQLSRVFGDFPIELDQDDSAKLLVMSDMVGTPGNVYAQLVDALAEHRSIVLRVY